MQTNTFEYLQSQPNTFIVISVINIDNDVSSLLTNINNKLTDTWSTIYGNSTNILNSINSPSFYSPIIDFITGREKSLIIMEELYQNILTRKTEVGNTIAPILEE